MSESIPRAEYPRPQFRRKDWLCLNGSWQFEIDPGDSGEQRGLVDRELADSILVPFCPESALSGIEHVDFMAAVWYRREVDVPAEWAGRRVLLHLQAVDYDTTVWAEGQVAGEHRGGWTPMTCDLGNVAGHTITIVIRARDDAKRQKPRGKQSDAYHNSGCHYTRTTGIWQSVWLEPVPDVALRRPRLWPDVAGGRICLEQPIEAGGPGPHRPGLRLRAALRDEQGIVATAECEVAEFCPRLDLPVAPERRRLWSPDDPHLYDLTIELLTADGGLIDAAESYAALRSVTLDGQAFCLNGEVLFQRLVLDQGYYPEGIMTAPTDEAMAGDIKLAQEAGFNGARLHQKVFEERFLYHADRLGYLCWGEFGDWGIGEQTPQAEAIGQWTEAVTRDLSHPCIIGWCPLNEQPYRGRWHDALPSLMSVLQQVTKAIDPTRPVIDSSGWVHVVEQPDMTDSHDYTQDPEELAANHAGLANGWGYAHPGARRKAAAYRGAPFLVSEFGGTWWNPQAAGGEGSWGYGERPATEEEFYERFQALCGVLLDNPHLCGYCYTQLTDVFQEQNGLYGFDRDAKFDIERLRQIQQRAAAIEQTAQQGAGEE
ncbi:MAG: glycoside hydrolase family 2 protein [Planctomycetota bacterium]